MQQLRAALEAADRARTAPQSPRFRDPTIEDAGRLDMVLDELHTDDPEGHQHWWPTVTELHEALKQCGFVVNAIGAKVGDKT